jgi:hypothetical protein
MEGNTGIRCGAGPWDKEASGGTATTNEVGGPGRVWASIDVGERTGREKCKENTGIHRRSGESKTGVSEEEEGIQIERRIMRVMDNRVTERCGGGRKERETTTGQEIEISSVIWFGKSR